MKQEKRELAEHGSKDWEEASTFDIRALTCIKVREASCLRARLLVRSHVRNARLNDRKPGITCACAVFCARMCGPPEHEAPAHALAPRLARARARARVHFACEGTRARASVCASVASGLGSAHLSTAKYP
eukprot:1372448-Pleurochrysis_carterae.AAC.2